MYLGLDLGTHAGWAVISPFKGRGTVLGSGAWDCSIKVGHDSPSLRFEKFSMQLDGWLALGPTRVFYELVRRHKGVEAAHVYGALRAKMQERCDYFGVPYEGIDVGTIKKHVAGKGNASKADMIRAVELLGWKPQSEDEADAIGVVITGVETRL